MLKEDFMYALYFRHDCRLFNESRRIPKADLEFILDAGRLSPSSMCPEQWKFVVIGNTELKNTLQLACRDPAPITSSSNAVVILSRRVGLGSGRAELPPGNLVSRNIARCHVAAANMMVAAAAIGVDSCPVGRFDQDGVGSALGIEKPDYEVAFLLLLGYRVNHPPAQPHRPLSELVEYR